MSAAAQRNGLLVSLPATSANLGPGFDAVGLAMSLRLQVEAHRAEKDAVFATGRDAALCGDVQNHLILRSYHEALQGAGQPYTPLQLRLENEIPLGMGCGSSAAARLAGVALARHFGRLPWTDEQVVDVASRMEGHPDNVAACWYGGFTVSVLTAEGVKAVSLPCDGTWELLLALPEVSLATETARAVLPMQVSREDAIFNLSRAALLTAAFAANDISLLREAMRDRLHQPYRAGVCGLLQHVPALQAGPEFAGVALSGAGPALLAILGERTSLQAAEHRFHAVVGRSVELVPLRIAGGVTVQELT